MQPIIVKDSNNSREMIMQQTLYPFLFEPNLHKVVWGGQRLRPWKGMTPNDDPIGESWEVSTVPSSVSVIANGVCRGKPLTDVISLHPEEILGRAVVRKYGCQLPLLVKFIDAERDLSIQVHPDDRMARQEHGKMGKSEMWYIIDAKPGAFLYCGFKEKLTPERYKSMVSDETIVDALARHEVKTGDVFYIPAGRVHAICGGILLAEVQQSSDVTYRIFDYNRPGMDGKPRELHTELAARALDYEVKEEYRTDYVDDAAHANHCIDSEFFNVRVVNVDAPFHRNLKKYDSFIISMCMMGNCTIRIRETGDTIDVHEGFSCLIPACIADYDVVPSGGSRECRLLDAFIDNRDNTIAGQLKRFLHVTEKGNK